IQRGLAALERGQAALERGQALLVGPRPGASGGPRPGSSGEPRPGASGEPGSEPGSQPGSEPGQSDPNRSEPGPYLLQAAIAACHARARTAEETDWAMIAGLYAVLAQRWPSPVVELNRAVAVSMAFGPELGLTIVDQLRDEPLLKNYHLLPGGR